MPKESFLLTYPITGNTSLIKRLKITPDSFKLWSVTQILHVVLNTTTVTENLRDKKVVNDYLICYG